ncbi:hypothetical protein VA596_29915 [Amycolatopsis sp., V23-08]|uniref:Uncharacterized protein n=1 Tax=Amycolatopsis heterodermiae TaxID=3110235 RepID=A0ABU5RCB4_9PSEU|nr:hypothetical protein [Amycolatopsis sp., V23-08]MEA5363783.1 hypothetical protein [Amycolatopsis sp., V23-08]
MRLAEATRTSLRELLAAELADAGARARNAGCPPEILAELFAARLSSAAEAAQAPDSCDGP